MSSAGVVPKVLVKRGFLALMLGAVFALTGAAGSASAEQPPNALGCMNYSQGLTTADGSVLIAGSSIPGLSPCNYGPNPRRMYLAQLRSDGSIDQDFATDGVLSLGVEEDDAVVKLLSVASDRTILVSSSSIIKVRPDGSFDPTFGQNGKVTNPFGGLPDPGLIVAAELQGDGKVVVAANLLDGLAVARLGENGDLDPTFGSGGVVVPPVPDGHTFSGLGAIGLDGQNRIVISGDYDNEVGALRLGANGATDLSYGTEGNGFAAADSGFGSSYVSPTISVDPDGSARIYGADYISLYYRSNQLWKLDPDGQPEPESPVYLDGLGSGIFAETPGGVVSTDLPDRYEPATFNVDKATLDGVAVFSKVFDLAPGDGSVSSISYDSKSDSLLVGGHVSDGGWAAVMRLNAQTGEPDSSFGDGGAVLLSENKCPFGIGPDRAGEPQAWNRCLVEPPTIRGNVKLQRPRSRRPSLSGTIRLVDPPAEPGAMTQRVVIRIPDRLRLTRKAKKKISASAYAFDQAGSLKVSAGRRTVTATFAPDLQGVDPYCCYAPVNLPFKVDFRFARGALKPIGRKLRRKPFKFVTRAAYVPVDYGNPARQSKWQAANKSTKTVKVKPVKGG